MFACPTTEEPLTHILVCTLRLHFGQMSRAFNEAHDKLQAGVWSRDEAEAFLQVQALNEAMKKRVWRISQHNLHWDEYINKVKTEEQLADELGVELGDDAFEVIRMKGRIPVDTPTSWDRAQPLATNIDVIMHLLFLGVWSTLVSVGMEWLRLNQMESSFLLFADGLLEQVQALNLDYCKVLGYKKGRLGGWVSENYLGFARIAGWFYCSFGATKRAEPYKQPQKDQSKWTKKENDAWLASRKLDRKGLAHELRARVAEQMALPGGPPPAIDSSGGSNTLFLNAVNGMLRVISVVMQDFMNDELILEMEFQIKLFMTLFEDLDSEMRKGKEKAKPKLVTTYNFFSLLNLPVAAGMLGPLRNLWEGGPMGEGYLQPIKAAITSGLRPGWEMKVMNTIHRNNGLSNVLKNWKEHDDVGGIDEDEEEGAVRRGIYHKYKSLATFVSSF